MRIGTLALLSLSLATVTAPANVPSQEASSAYRFRAVDLPEHSTRGDDPVTLDETPQALIYTPKSGKPSPTAVLFFPGASVDPHAYEGLARGLAIDGHQILIAKLPGGFSLVEPRNQAGLALGRQIQADHPEIKRWCVAGHSLGGAIAARFAHEATGRTDALVLIATTHPRDFDLSSLTIPVTKIQAENDRVAPTERSEANASLLPKATQWLTIAGANHAQFGHYGVQPGDGEATIKRTDQQQQTIEAITKLLNTLDERDHPQ